MCRFCFSAHLPLQGPAIEVTEKMVESVAVLVWSAEANSIKKAMEPSAVHDTVCKVTQEDVLTSLHPLNRVIVTSVHN